MHCQVTDFHFSSLILQPRSIFSQIAAASANDSGCFSSIYSFISNLMLSPPHCPHNHVFHMIHQTVICKRHDIDLFSTFPAPEPAHIPGLLLPSALLPIHSHPRLLSEYEALHIRFHVHQSQFPVFSEEFLFNWDATSYSLWNNTLMSSVNGLLICSPLKIRSAAKEI